MKGFCETKTAKCNKIENSLVIRGYHWKLVEINLVNILLLFSVKGDVMVRNRSVAIAAQIDSLPDFKTQTFIFNTAAKPKRKSDYFIFFKEEKTENETNFFSVGTWWTPGLKPSLPFAHPSWLRPAGVGSRGEPREHATASLRRTRLSGLPCARRLHHPAGRQLSDLMHNNNNNNNNITIHTSHVCVCVCNTIFYGCNASYGYLHRRCPSHCSVFTFIFHVHGMTNTA